jgi:hypothetical protein
MEQDAGSVFGSAMHTVLDSGLSVYQLAHLGLCLSTMDRCFLSPARRYYGDYLASHRPWCLGLRSDACLGAFYCARLIGVGFVLPLWYMVASEHRSRWEFLQRLGHSAAQRAAGRPGLCCNFNPVLAMMTVYVSVLCGVMGLGETLLQEGAASEAPRPSGW